MLLVCHYWHISSSIPYSKELHKISFYLRRMNAFHYYYLLFLFFTFFIDVNNWKMITYVCNQYTLDTICQTIQIIAKNIIYQSSWWFSNSSWPIDQGNKGICIHHICKFSCCSMHIIIHEVNIIVTHNIALFILFLYLYDDFFHSSVEFVYISSRGTIYCTHDYIFIHLKYTPRYFNKDRFHTFIKIRYITSLSISNVMHDINGNTTSNGIMSVLFTNWISWYTIQITVIIS